MKILSEAYGSNERREFYEYTRSLEALKLSMKGDKTIFLPADSFIGKLLQGK